MSVATTDFFGGMSGLPNYPGYNGSIQKAADAANSLTGNGFTRSFLATLHGVKAYANVAFKTFRLIVFSGFLKVAIKLLVCNPKWSIKDDQNSWHTISSGD